MDDTAIWRGDISGTNAPSSVIDWDETDDGGGYANRIFTDSAVTPSSADINAWVIRVYQQAYAQTMAPDGLQWEIDEIELILDYDISAGGAIIAACHHFFHNMS